MLMFLRCVTANAQAGFFEIENLVNDPNTAMTRCTINSLKGLFWQELSNDVNALFTTEKKERMAFEVELASAKLDNFSVELVGANPAGAETQLDLVLPSELTVNVSLIDSKGFVVRNFSQELPSGRSSILLADLPPTPGIYTVLVQTSAGQGSLRFVKL
ncbi:MAG: hypothetical protein OHK0019_11200 [Saprospiraceae bacterium]